MKEITRQDYFERIKSVLVYIEANVHRSITLEELAEVACFSPYHFHRIFRSWVGESLAVYLRRLRVEHAATALRYSDKRVFDIALDAGFSSPESFAKAFRKRFDLSPQQYRDTFHIEKVEIELTLEMVRHRVFYERENTMIDVKIVKQATRKIAAIRHVGPYDQVGPIWQSLCEWAGPKGLLKESTQYIGLSYDDPNVCDDNTIRYDASITLDQDVISEGEVTVKEIEAGDFATIVHVGPFDTMKDTYNEFFVGWLPDSGREVKNGAVLEIYLNDPETTPPEELRVEIGIPLV